MSSCFFKQCKMKTKIQIHKKPNTAVFFGCIYELVHVVVVTCNTCTFL